MPVDARIRQGSKAQRYMHSPDCILSPVWKTKIDAPLLYFFCIVDFSSSEHNCSWNDLPGVQGLSCSWKCNVRYVFCSKKWYKEELIQVNLMANVREELRLNNSTIPIWLHNLQIYDIFSQHNKFSISDLILLYKILFIFNYKFFSRIPYYLPLPL